MKNDNLAALERFAGTLAEPEDFFSGKCLPAGFALPDNILIFFHDFTAPVPNSHGRHTLVIPFDEMTYFIEQKQILLHPGLILYVPPYAVRFLHPDSAGYRRLFITFDTRGQQEYLPEMGAFELEKSYPLLQKVLAEYQAGNMDECVPALLKFLKHQKQVPFHAPGESELPKLLVQTVSRIETQLSELYSIKTLSDSLQISESHLRTLFRQYMGVSIGRFIAEKKMDYARYCLLNSDRSIAEIAQRSGFANVYVFSAFFKRNEGLSPLHFRHKNRSGERI